MTTKEDIIKYAHNNLFFSGYTVFRDLGCSHWRAKQLLSELEKEGKIILYFIKGSGSTYTLNEKREGVVLSGVAKITKEIKRDIFSVRVPPAALRLINFREGDGLRYEVCACEGKYKLNIVYQKGSEEIIKD